MGRQPMALRVADAVENLQLLVKVTNEQAAKELRRLHEVNEALCDELEAACDMLDSLGHLSAEYRAVLKKARGES